MLGCLERFSGPFIVGTEAWSSIPLLQKSLSITQPLRPARQNDAKNPLTPAASSSVVVTGRVHSQVCLRLSNLSLTGAVFFPPQTPGTLYFPATSLWSSKDTQSPLCVPEQAAIIGTAGKQRAETYIVIMAFFECDLLTDMCSVNCMWFLISWISPVHHNYSVIIASFAQNKTLLITAQREPLKHSQLYTEA